MTMPDAATMRVIEASGAGGPEVLAISQRPVPVPGPGQAMIP